MRKSSWITDVKRMRKRRPFDYNDDFMCWMVVKRCGFYALLPVVVPGQIYFEEG